jgi:Ca2+-transporting ATPase
MTPTVSETAKLSDFIERLGTDLDEGLSATEAAERLTAGRNELPDAPRVSIVQRIWRQVREPMSLLLLAAAVVSLVALRELGDAIAIGAIVVINIVIAIVQEERAADALEALRAAAAPTASVIRSGKPALIPAAEVVPGDVVLLASGDRVAADLWLIDGWSLETNESMLTGESLAVAKAKSDEGDMSLPLADRTWLAYAGTLISAGSGKGLVIATGPMTEVGRLAGHLSRESPPTPLQKNLAKLSARLGKAAVGIALAVFVLILIRLGEAPGAIEQAFLAAVAMAVAAVPEGLPTVVTLSLALGVKRMARLGAIVRNLPAVETLGSTTILLTDKTGTLTQNRMLLASVITPDGKSISPGELSGSIANAVLRVVALCNDATVDPPHGDPVEIALLEPFALTDIVRIRADHPRVAKAPFDSSRKMMSTLHRTRDGFELLTKGAPEAVLAATVSVMTAESGRRVFTSGDRSALLAHVDELASTGARVLALAHRSLDNSPDNRSGDLLGVENELELIGLAVLHDPLRPEAASTVARMDEANIRLVMVTGDHAGTASAIARAAGLTHSQQEVLNGTELRSQGAASLDSVRVYARVDPEQKLQLVEAFQKAGHVVAVTGDGVNDAPALRRADIGVAMGRSGSQVAREAADLVITDDDLDLVTKAVREGRGIFDNIRKVVDYLVAGNLSEVTVVLSGLAFFPDMGLPLLPLQLLWINLLTDGLPALALGFDRHRQDLLIRPLGSPTAQLLSPRRLIVLGVRALALAGGAIGALIAVRASGGSWAEARTVMFTALVVAHLLYAYVVRLPWGASLPNPRLAIAVALGILLQVAIVVGPFDDTFGVVPIDGQSWLVALIAGVVPVVLLAVSRIGQVTGSSRWLQTGESARARIAPRA